MKIENSSVAMASTHSQASYTQTQSITMTAQASKDVTGAILTLSQEGEASYMESMQEYQKQQQEEEEEEREKQNYEMTRQIQDMADRARKANEENKSGKIEISDEYRMKLEMIKRLFEMLKNGQRITSGDIPKWNSENGTLDLRSASNQDTGYSGASVGTGVTSNATRWQRVTATSGYTSESEDTTFASKGMVQTADGRSIDFSIEVSMSRSFTSEINTLEKTNYILTDPLVINLDTNVGSVTDQKFYFDLNSDGTEESISFAGKGSGFLALDKNEDGIINDGSELFGTKSGNGFGDLAAYDEDGNGWIDENDSIFSRLRVWTKDENGNDYLMDLKKADVGAIYLGSEDTQFHLKNDENKLNGAIRRTGIYLKESTGKAGTINHVDLAI